MTPDPDGRSANPTSESGFTLIEALVATVVLAVGLISVANLMVVAASSNAVASQATAATTVASQELERLTAIPYDQLVAGGDLDGDTAGYFSDTDIAGAGIIHTRWLIVAPQNQTRFIVVRAQGTGPLTGARSRAEFTTFRSCTSVLLGCPPPP
jgi:prepilin-type N-terminal cleavage/methylation domain-containing protein